MISLCCTRRAADNGNTGANVKRGRHLFHDNSGDKAVHVRGVTACRRRRSRRLLARMLPGSVLIALAFTLPELSVGAGDIGKRLGDPEPPEPAANPIKVGFRGAIDSAQAGDPASGGGHYVTIVDLDTNRREGLMAPRGGRKALSEPFPPALPNASSPRRPEPEAKLEPSTEFIASPGQPPSLPLFAPSGAASTSLDAASAPVATSEPLAMPMPQAAPPLTASMSGTPDPGSLLFISKPSTPDRPDSVARVSFMTEEPAALRSSPSARLDLSLPFAVPVSTLPPATAPTIPTAKTAPTSDVAPPLPVAGTPDATSSGTPDYASASVALDPKLGLALPLSAEVQRMADLDVKSQLITRVEGRTAGALDFQQTAGGLKVRLGSVVEVLADRYDPGELARIRASSAGNAWLSLAELQAQGVPISYDPVYDEFNIGNKDTRPRDASKVHMRQIGVPDRGPAATRIEQVTRQP